MRFTCLVCLSPCSFRAIQRLELLHCIHSDTLSGSNIATSVLILDIDQPQWKVVDSKADYVGYEVGRSALTSAPGSAAGDAVPYHKKACLRRVSYLPRAAVACKASTLLTTAILAYRLYSVILVKIGHERLQILFHNHTLVEIIRKVFPSQPQDISTPRPLRPASCNLHDATV